MKLTAAQQNAVLARGNVLVSAAAGTGKTRTLIARCLHFLCEEKPRASLEEILIVTFTEAAATEMRERLRAQLEEKYREQPDDPHWAEQLALFDTANIGTLHSFCFKLVRQHFYELKLDPQMSVLAEGEARLLADESIEALLEKYYSEETDAADAVQQLIRFYGGSKGDSAIRNLILRLHHYAQTRPNPGVWLESQLKMFSSPEPVQWRQSLLEGIADWKKESEAALEHLAPQNEKANECLRLLRSLPASFTREQAADVLNQLQKAGEIWPPKKKGALKKPLESFFEDVNFLASLATVTSENDPLAEDWNWVRGHMTTLLQLTSEFSGHFCDAKRESGALDFHDLEQFTLQLLWDFEGDRPTRIAEQWRRKIRFVFVDEYQDINAAQDKIIQALSHDESFGVPPSGGSAPRPPEGGTPNGGNRFLVGDVKQSIYRFRLAEPSIFSNYSQIWCGDAGNTLPLVENFRSREGILRFINDFFALHMRMDQGGVNYDSDASLQFGEPKTRSPLSVSTNPGPRTELVIRVKGKTESSESSDENSESQKYIADLEEAEKEAYLIAQRFAALKKESHPIWDEGENRFRPVEWSDMALLLRAPSNKAESYAKAFARAGVPLIVERGGFYDASEVADLLNVLKLLDNPLQDVPLIGVLRSPLVGLSLDELAEIRLAVRKENFWTALNRRRDVLRVACSVKQPTSVTGTLDATRNTQHATFKRIDNFLNRFARWRKLARQISLSRCLENILAETLYADWLRGQDRGEQRYANVRQFVHLAERFDEFQQQGLFRFLKFIEAQQAVEIEPEVPATAGANAVRLMSIHQSKGLEFPVVAIADLGKAFNERDLNAEIILDEKYGLCPQVKPPHTNDRYQSLSFWLARRRQKREMISEELRLLYVAMTRARDTLILSASVAKKAFESRWKQTDDASSPLPSPPLREERESSIPKDARSCADWLAIWFAKNCSGTGILPVGSNRLEACSTTQGETAFVRWKLFDDSQPVSLEAENEKQVEEPAVLLDANQMEELRRRLSWEYPFPAATGVAAKASVSTLRRQAEEMADEEAVLIAPNNGALKYRKRINLTKATAADVGTSHHTFLERVSFERVGSETELRDEAERLEREKILSAEEIALLDFKALARFWKSDLGQKICERAEFVQRELPFTARFFLEDLRFAGTLASPTEGLADEFVVVQGIADLVVLLPKEIWLVDFKTDEIKGGDVAAKAKVYEVQLKLYAMALSRVYGRPVTACWIYFLSAQTSVAIETEPDFNLPGGGRRTTR